MAGFIDSLAIMLIGLGSGLLLVALFVLFSALNKLEDLKEKLAIPAMGIGFFDFVSGFIMAFTWPLPGGYNMLFGDPLLFFGLLLFLGSYMFYKGKSPSWLTIFAFIIGIYVILGAYAMAADKLETGANFLPAFGLYLSSGISALLSPILILKPVGAVKALYYLEFIILIVATFVALFIGYNALLEHLVSFAHYYPA
ncbi:MAG: DUF981 family protein [Thermoplasmata archaeon]